LTAIALTGLGAGGLTDGPTSRRENTMRRILLAALAATGLGSTGALLGAPGTAAAETVYPICLHWRATAPDCRFASMAQCMASASGIGADCLYNPAYAFARGPGYDEPVSPQRRAKRQRPVD